MKPMIAFDCSAMYALLMTKYVIFVELVTYPPVKHPSVISRLVKVGKTEPI